MANNLNIPQNINNKAVQPAVNPLYNAGVATTQAQTAANQPDLQTQGYYNPSQQVYANNMLGYYGAPQSAQQTAPQASCSAVTIKIENPTVSAGGNNCSTCPQPAVQQPVMQQPPVQQQPAPQPAPVATKPQEQPKTDEKKPKKEKEITQLTDNYVKTVENYLNNENPEVRRMGAKEVLARYKEDKTRKNDVVLTNLLNKILQDPDTSVRMLGITALDVGYAEGNDETIQILTNMQKSDKLYGQDSLAASELLLKLSGNQKIKIEDTDPPKETKKDSDTKKEEDKKETKKVDKDDKKTDNKGE